MKAEILCITHKYPPSVGGMERQSFELIQGLKQHFEAHVIAYQGNGNKTIWFASLPWRIKSILKEHPGITLIHLNDASMGVACLWLQKAVSIPIVITCHGLDITFPMKLYQRHVIPRLSHYAGAICVSRFTREECLKRGFRPDTTYTVRNGVDMAMGNTPVDPSFPAKLIEKYGINVASKKIILAVGRPVKRKGFSWFMENVLPGLEEDVIFLMAGPLRKKPAISEKIMNSIPGGDNLQLLMGSATDSQRVIRLLNGSKNAFHLGNIPYDDLLQLLSLADLFVMPNIRVKGDQEGFGLVALEASIRGTHVVASGIEGITDAVIDGKNGTLLPSKDANAWIKEIRQLLSDRVRLRQLSEKGREFTIKNYPWSLMVEGYKSIFEERIQSFES